MSPGLSVGCIVSIHAPVKGRPWTPGSSSSCSWSFNPRPREGATWQKHKEQYYVEVSIHAPVKGRPRLRAIMGEPIVVSIHAPVKGRRRLRVDRLQGLCFNPRPREGATYKMQLVTYCKSVSIHAPVKGRRHSAQTPQANKTFQSTPP